VLARRVVVDGIGGPQHDAALQPRRYAQLQLAGRSGSRGEPRTIEARGVSRPSGSRRFWWLFLSAEAHDLVFDRMAIGGGFAVESQAAVDGVRCEVVGGDQLVWRLVVG